MNRKRNIIVTSALALLGVAGIVWVVSGQGSHAVPSGAAESRVQMVRAQLPPTKIVVYVPTMPPGPAPTRNGSCWTGSIAAPFRTDAWRCMTGNAISDPCFEIPGSRELLCGANPARRDLSLAFPLRLTKPLPEPAPAHGPAPADWAWLVELSDGTICSPFTGTMPIAADGRAAKYGCAPKAPGEAGRMIFGDFTSRGEAEFATVGALKPSSRSLPVITNESQVAVATIWQ